MNALTLILQILGAAAQAAQQFTPGCQATGVEQIAAALATIAEKAIGAYQQVTGEPLDLSKLKPIDPVQ